MSLSASRPPGPDIPGWYPDPARRFQERYWLRGQWTNRVRYRGAEAIDPCEVDQEQGPTRQPVVDSGHGWRPDPTGRFQHRWFDGEKFTRTVCVGPSVATDTQGAPKGSRRDRRQRAAAHDPGPQQQGPGWYPDPEGPGERFYDGYVWSAKWRAGSARQLRREHSIWGWMPQTVLRALVGMTLLVVVLLVVVLLVVVL